MVKLLSIKNILYCIVLIFISTALLITCEWTSEVSTNISKESTKSPKASAERFGEIEEKKIDYSDKVQQVQISQTKVNSEIYRITDSITKSNELIILDFKVKPGETLSSILTPINGVPYSTILKISETNPPRDAATMGIDIQPCSKRTAYFCSSTHSLFFLDTLPTNIQYKMEGLQIAKAQLKAARDRQKRDCDALVATQDEVESYFKQRLHELNKEITETIQAHGSKDVADGDIVKVNDGGKVVAAK